MDDTSRRVAGETPGQRETEKKRKQIVQFRGKITWMQQGERNIRMDSSVSAIPVNKCKN